MCIYIYTHINLTIDGAIYLSQNFPFGAAFVCQAGNFWTPPSCIYIYKRRKENIPYHSLETSLSVCKSATCFDYIQLVCAHVKSCLGCNYVSFIFSLCMRRSKHVGHVLSKNSLPDEGPLWPETCTRSFVKLVYNNIAFI